MIESTVLKDLLEPYSPEEGEYKGHVDRGLFLPDEGATELGGGLRVMSPPLSGMAR